MEERFTPQMYLDWYIKQHGIDVEDIGVAPVIVLSWSLGIVQSLAESINAKIPEHWFYGERNLFI